MDVVSALADIVSRPEGTWTVAEGALAISRLGRNPPDASKVLGDLDALGARARSAVPRDTHPRFFVLGLGRFLTLDAGFECVAPGDRDADLSFLDRVLATRRGSPVAMAILYIEMARRCGRRLETVSLPGRTLLRLEHDGAPLLHDPTSGGRAVSIEECRQTIEHASGGRQSFREAWLRPLTPLQLLARLLTDVKRSFWSGTDHARALETIELLLVIRPDDPREIRDRGRALFALGRYREAIQAFEAFLSLNPFGEEAEAVRLLLLEARQGLAQ
jgi:regulator of sirC expression with transglutaminase-like and TPR domain